MMCANPNIHQFLELLQEPKNLLFQTKTFIGNISLETINMMGKQIMNLESFPLIEMEKNDKLKRFNTKTTQSVCLEGDTLNLTFLSSPLLEPLKLVLSSS
jgi:hypothetical protein